MAPRKQNDSSYVSPYSQSSQPRLTRRTTSSAQAAPPITLEVLNKSIESALDKHLEKVKVTVNESLDNALKELREQVNRIEKDLKDVSEKSKTAIAQLSKRVEEIESNVANDPSPLQLITDSCNEIAERTKRAKNIIVYGFPENSKNSDDLKSMNELFLDIKLELQAKFALRLGKKVANRMRPLKLIFDSVNQVSSLFRHKKLLDDKNLKIKNDMTPCERAYLEAVRAELDERIADGEENLKIKFVNKTPTIVTTEHEKNE